MIAKDFRGYIESRDITDVSMRNLVYPSKNVMVKNGKIYRRGGLVNDGVAKTANNKIHSEFVWKDSLGGIRPIRCTGQKVQVKYNSKWYTIFESLDANVVQVFFATWVDANGSVVKKRLFFVDGSTSIYQWNGAIAEVESADSTSVTFATAGGTCLLRGFDDGSATNQTIMHFIGSAVTANSEETQTNNPTGQVLNISGTFNTTPVAGDVIIAKPVAFADEISSTFNIDAIYSYKNHVIVASYDSVEVFWSHIETYSLSTGLDFTQPGSGSRTALTPIYMRLDGNFTAMASRKNVLWISDANDWYKCTKSVEQNAYGLWVDIDKFETGENKGALPMAVAQYKSDLIYMAQDKTLQRVESVEVTGLDDIRQISDEVEDLFLRLDVTDMRIYYLERAIYIIFPVDSTLIILDMIENFFQPPQTLPLQCISVIGGVKYGHHSAVDETFVLFSGTSDLGTEIQSVIATPLHSDGHPFRYKHHSTFGMSVRMNTQTNVKIEHYFEETGAKEIYTTNVVGENVTYYSVDEDLSWATYPYGDRSWGGADMESSTLKRAMIFDKMNATSYFDYRIIMTISGSASEFQLIEWWIDDQVAKRKIGDNLFVSQ